LIQFESKFDQVDAYDNNPIPGSLDFTIGEPQGTFSRLQVIFVWDADTRKQLAALLPFSQLAGRQNHL